MFVDFTTQVEVGEKFDNVGYITSLREAISQHFPEEAVVVLPVSPWGSFTLSLNAALHLAIKGSYDIIGFQSLETVMSGQTVSHLLKLFEKNESRSTSTLVVGPVFNGHLFVEGIHQLTGRQCPWNTFALWSVAALSLTGFPAVGDGQPDGVQGGVEEVTTISLLQHVNPQLKAYLVQIDEQSTGNAEPQAIWNVSLFSNDPARLEWHERKMASKDTRPAAQLERLALPTTGTCEHIRLVITASDSS